MRPDHGTSGRPRLLYLAFYFPPTRASGVYRARATANHFAQAGWEVTVVTPPREFFRDVIGSYDPSLEDTVDPAVTVERVPFRGWRWDPDLRRYSALRAYFPERWVRWRDRWETALFPEPYAPWISPTVGRVRRMHRENPFDLVLATGNPWSSFVAAWALRRLTGLPYVMDYRDPWTLDIYRDAPAFPRWSRAWRWERRVIGGATRVLHVNEALRDWHARRYPRAADRMRVVENGWEPEFVGDLARPKARSNTGVDRPLRLGYLGTLTHQVPLGAFFEGWRLARKDPVLADASVRLYGHLGYFQGRSALLRDMIPLDEGINVSFEGARPKAEVQDVYRSLDVLLLLLGTSRYVTSGKVYEYLATGRPIVSVHDPSCAASDTLRGYPLWFPVRDLSPESIEVALVRAALAARTTSPGEVAQATEYARRYTRDAQIAPLEHDLRRLVSQHRGVAQ